MSLLSYYIRLVLDKGELLAVKSKKKKYLLRPLKFRIEYIGVLLLAVFVRTMPRIFSLKFGGWLGLLSYWLLPNRRRLADENMRLALPELSASERKLKVRQVFVHNGTSGIEMLRLNMFRTDNDDLDRYFEFVGTKNITEAYAMGRGVLFLTGHLGFWEVGNFSMPTQGFPFDVVAKPMKNRLTDRYINDMRETYGARVLDSKKGARRILKSLQDGRGVAILLDQHIRPPGSVPVDFFGRKAYTTTAITNMAMKYQIPVVPTFVQRLPDFRYRITSEPMMMLENGKGSELIMKNTQMLTDKIEAAIRKDVTQWFWMHKRWRVPAEAVSEES